MASKTSYKNVGSGVNISLESNEELTEELHKPIIRKFFKKKQSIQDLKTIFGELF